jgi:hypothetical protein
MGDHAMGEAPGAGIARGEKPSGRRPYRVRSKLRRRGSRGKGGKGKLQKQGIQTEAAKTPTGTDVNAVSTSPHPENRDGEVHRGDSGDGRPSAQKKARERKNRKWKPFSEMTWQER